MSDIAYNIKELNITNPLILAICISEYNGGSNNLPGVKIDKTAIFNLAASYNYTIIGSKDSVSEKEFNNLLDYTREKLKKNDEKFDGFIMIYSGHGDEGVWLTSDYKYIHINTVMESFYGDKLPNFVNLPKVIFSDACRGSDVIKPVKTDDDKEIKLVKQPLLKYSHPGNDFTVVFGNVLGFVTFDSKNGGYLIQSLTYGFNLNKNNSMEFNNLIMQMRQKVLSLSTAKMTIDMHTTNSNYITYYPFNTTKFNKTTITTTTKNIIKNNNDEDTKENEDQIRVRSVMFTGPDVEHNHVGKFGKSNGFNTPIAGLNYAGYCREKTCPAFNKYVVCQRGMGEFRFNEDVALGKVTCPGSNHQFKAVWFDCVMRCRVLIQYVKANSGAGLQQISRDVPEQFYRFGDGKDVQYTMLIIKTSKM